MSGSTRDDSGSAGGMGRREFVGLLIGLLVGVILVVGGLTFFPALALGPIVEHLAMLAGQSF